MMELRISKDPRRLVISKSFTDLLTENRLLDYNYLPVPYVPIDNGDYNFYPIYFDYEFDVNFSWEIDATGLVIHNGELIYPEGYSEIRSYYKKIKSTETATLSQLRFEINHTGSITDWLTDQGTGGTVAGNNIKFEFLIKRTDNTTYGWFNPFASYNSYGVANIELNRLGSITTVACTLSIVPRVNHNDLIIVRVFAGEGWPNKIRSIKLV